jgi:signal transduction histidine kinase
MPMNALHRPPLRLRLTLLTAVVLTVICVLLTMTSVFTAHRIYSVPAEDQPPHAFPPPPAADRPNNEFAYASVVYMLIMIAAGTGASYFIAGKALKPVADLSRRIESIDESKLFQRLEGFDTNDEVASLAASFNHMIVKLEKAFHHHKQFAANAAHELRTPLTGIIANIEVLQLDEDPTVQDYKEVVEDTYANALRLMMLVDDLLKMNGAFHADRCVNFAAKDMFGDIVSALSESSRAKNIRIENNIADVILFGEQALLQRAFFNLLQNAVKYNEINGEIVITATLKDDVVTVNIRDTGIGIPEDELKSVFEPFYRVDTSRSRELGGSGLGLSIAKMIVDMHNGKIGIKSEIGYFSEVTVTLPKN